VNPNPLIYVLVTPARNEEEFIELTIKSVIAQTVRPLKWIIVSDGSTDRTDEIARKYTAEHSWIELLRMPERKERHFGGKVLCFRAACERVKDLTYDVIGNLDADISFESDLFACLLNRFAENPRLGVGGAPFSEGKGTYDFRFSSAEHVSGACQFFRRECFEAIGGYMPIKGGGIDVVAVLMARMNGWQTRTFPETVCVHHRSMGSAGYGSGTISFRLGQKDYVLGRHPLWELFRSFYQMTRRPFVLGGSTLLAGYVWAMVKRVERPVSKELVRFQRREQMARLKRFFLDRRTFNSCRTERTAHDCDRTLQHRARAVDARHNRGMLIINADDWGGWKRATDSALACYQAGRITSVSAMVFMEDSGRAAALAKEAGLDVGLHINFTTAFSGNNCPALLAKRQDRIRRFLKRIKYALLLYHPFLRAEFRCVFQAQVEEFVRLYGQPPSHVDGHQHMHLGSNMLWDRIVPEGQTVRRSFSFWPGEKSLLNRTYRRWVDQQLSRRYRMTDYFFALSQCLRHQRLVRVAELAKTAVVELMAHPEKAEEGAWLMSDGHGEILRGLQTGTFPQSLAFRTSKIV
jgi:predicted glycoside hydrolase/deacetylase ChbG (UPF0249 family)/GT2 family glycosyltransferase